MSLSDATQPPSPARIQQSTSASVYPAVPPLTMNPAQPASSANPGTGAPPTQTPGHPSFRRQRASRACETCHARKVRCDAASLGVPCTNCVAFSIECKIPAPKRKKTQSKGKDNERSAADDPHLSHPHPPQLTPHHHSDQAESTADNVSLTPTNPAPDPVENPRDRASAMRVEENALGIKPTEAARDMGTQPDGNYSTIMKPKFVRAPIKEAGRVAYLGESSNLSLLVHDRHGSADVVHYPLPENIKGSRSRMNDLDNVEIDILHQRGAFLLPPRALCDELIEAFFTWVSPVVPVVNRARFMRRYRDSKNPPSLLLLQAMLLAGSRVCRNPQLMDSTGSTTPAAMTFYKRAKALFDANYEDDRVTIVQALILMGWYWEGPEDVTKNVFYWSRVAIIVAQGSGMHRSVESSQLSKADKRLWKRIWWTLFTRDRSVAVALGRPVSINTDDSDVEMISEDDFNDDEGDRPSDYPPDPVHIQFFLNYVKLCEIMGLVLSQQYSVASKGRKHSALDLTHSDMALADWLQNCPREVFWEKSRHHFWSALLHSNYYTTLCLLHRAHMPPAGGSSTNTYQNGLVMDNAYPSRNIAYQAAGMITSIVESLQQHDQLRYTPAFIVYSLFSALIMHVYQMRSSNAAVVSATEGRMRTCMEALRDVSKIWLVAKMVHTLFESILGNKQLEERLQKAAGRRHQRIPKAAGNGATPVPAPSGAEVGQKRKFEDTGLDFGGGPTQPTVSYERSRPQTPAMTPSRDMGPGGALPADPHVSPSLNRAEPSNGLSRGLSRPTTPYHPGASMPSTPPDLFLVTRNSPTISHEVWNNFQPDQLFPAEAQINFPTLSPNNTGTQGGFIDPALAQGPQGQPPNLSSTQFPGAPLGSMDAGQGGAAGQQQEAWAQFNETNQREGPLGNDETWSNSSVSQGPAVPTTLNVEDWFQFFGISGDPHAMQSAMGGGSTQPGSS